MREKQKCGRIAAAGLITSAVVAFAAWMPATTGAEAAAEATAKVAEPEKGVFSGSFYLSRVSSDRACDNIWKRHWHWRGIYFEYRGNIKNIFDYGYSGGLDCTFSPDKGTATDDGAVQTAKGKLTCRYMPENFQYQARATLTIYASQKSWNLQSTIDATGTGKSQGCDIVQDISGVWVAD